MMKCSLLHNKIIRDTATPSFISGFEEVLVPKLYSKYGDALLEVQMYEDYLGDGFVYEDNFYYPLTLVFESSTKREWVKWNISDKKNFENSVPYAYVGKENLCFEIADEAPAGFENKLLGRGAYFEEGLLTLNIDAETADRTFLVGKYSQTFIDEMTRQISREIERKCSVSEIENSGIELTLLFAPSTYMEHVVENTTYRRLLITARGCSARDLWIKWTRLNSMTPFTISESVSKDSVRFEIEENVPQKIREKEYRFLARTSAEKYQYAMSRKNVTEWRELIKRCIKRGELVKCDVPKFENAPEENTVAKKLQEALGVSLSERSAEPASETCDNSDITDLLKNLLTSENESETTDNQAETLERDEEVLEPMPESITLPTEEPEPQLFAEEPAAENSPVPVADTYVAEAEPPKKEIDEAELRRKIETELREKLLREAAERAEAERQELLRAHEELKAENERLINLARKAEEERISNEERNNAETERLRLEIEAREKAEAREKERLAEAARLAILEQQRLAEDRAEQEKREAERARLEEEQRRAEELARLEEERARKEKEEREAILAAQRAAEPRYTYVSKNARLLFRRPVDPNITKRIYEIILATIKYFHKEDVFIKIKASIPDESTVNLHFEKIPEEENELLINIIKVLGKSELGITKVFLE